MHFLGAYFKVLHVSIPLWVFMVIFLLIGLISLAFYLFFLFKNKSSYKFLNQEMDMEEFKKVNLFEEKRDNFEIELAKIKKQFKV